MAGFPKIEGLVTLTSDQVILHTVVHHLSTSTYMPNFTEIKELFGDRRTYVRTDRQDLWDTPQYELPIGGDSSAHNDHCPHIIKYPDICQKMPLPLGGNPIHHRLNPHSGSWSVQPFSYWLQTSQQTHTHTQTHKHTDHATPWVAIGSYR